MDGTQNIAIDYASFDEAWWDKFLDATKQLSTPTVVRNAMPRRDTFRMRRDILDIITELATVHKERYGIRLWLDGVLTSSDLIFDNPPVPEDTIESWTTRVFGQQKFGIILNRGEKFSEHLSGYVASKLSPLISMNGMPTEGLLFTLFIGNYDKTPLGIHKDLPGKSVVHFHLGPGPKEMFTWDDGVLESKLGPQPGNIYDVENHLSTANRHYFEEGDLYFMPENMYHVGKQEGLSIAVGCWYNNRSDKHFAERLFSLARQKYLRSSNVMLKADKNAPDDVTSVDGVLDLITMPSDYNALDLKGFLKEVYRDFRMALFSNAALRNAPTKNLTPFVVSEGTVVQAQLPYRILYRRSLDGARLTVYVRGSAIEVNYFHQLVDLIDRLNNGQAIQVAELIANCGPSWPVQAVHYFLERFHEAKGIRSYNSTGDVDASCKNPAVDMKVVSK